MPPLTCPELHELYQQTEEDIALFQQLAVDIRHDSSLFDELVGAYQGIHKNWMQLKFNGDEEKESVGVKELTGATKIGKEKDRHGWLNIRLKIRKEAFYNPLINKQSKDFFKKIVGLHDLFGWWSVETNDGHAIWYNPEQGAACQKVFEAIGRPDCNGWWRVPLASGKFTLYNPEKGEGCQEPFEYLQISSSNGYWEVKQDGKMKRFNPSTEEFKEI